MKRSSPLPGLPTWLDLMATTPGPWGREYRFDRFSTLDDLRMREEANPQPQRGEVLVHVHAVSLNFSRRHAARALPAQMPPRSHPDQ